MRAWVRARSHAARAGARIGHTIKAAISVRVRKVAKQRHLEPADALTIQQTAQAMARGLASKVESMGWRSVQPSELEDLAAIFRQHLALVYNQCGFVPGFYSAWDDSEGGGAKHGTQPGRAMRHCNRIGTRSRRQQGRRVRSCGAAGRSLGKW